MREHNFSTADLALFAQSPFAAWMELLDKRQQWHEGDPDHSLAFYRRDELVVPARHNVLQQRLMGRHGGAVNIDPLGFDAERHLSTQNAMGTGIALITNAFLAEMPLNGRLDFLVRQEQSSQLGNFHYVPACLAREEYDPTQMPVELCCFVDMLEHVQGVRPREFLWITDGQGDHPQVTSIASDDWMFDYRQLKIGYRKMLSNFDAREVLDPRESSDWGRWSGYARQLISELERQSG